MSGWTRESLLAALKAAGVVPILGWVLVLSAGPAPADPDPAPAPGDPGVVAPPADSPAPDPLAAPVAAGTAAGQDPTPFTGTAPFGRPSFVPANGSTVGVAQPIIINFPGTVEDAGAAISAVHVSSVPPVAGKFYWMTPTQLRWRPLSFWPAHTAVTVDAGGTVSSFHTGDTLVATADDATHQLTVTRNG
ncbi:MAG: hypothetical protein JO280_12240, partial [Mycobacteriaceae bacterium]|nr:hypothetical protein [Mycobacteriaceae bacterium]